MSTGLDIEDPVADAILADLKKAESLNVICATWQHLAEWIRRGDADEKRVANAEWVRRAGKPYPYHPSYDGDTYPEGD